MLQPVFAAGGGALWPDYRSRASNTSAGCGFCWYQKRET
jgi:hypothetical protein